jgi:hypothetical protein
MLNNIGLFIEARVASFFIAKISLFSEYIGVCRSFKPDV